jgi:hypothetical protein
VCSLKFSPSWLYCCFACAAEGLTCFAYIGALRGRIRHDFPAFFRVFLKFFGNTILKSKKREVVMSFNKVEICNVDTATLATLTEDEKQELLFNQAVCYEYMGDFETAYTLFSEYIAKYPNDADARKELDFLSSR